MGYLKGSEGKEFHVIAYADDVLILVRGIHLSVLMGFIQEALRLVESWCHLIGITVNPEKVEVTFFTQKSKVEALRGPTLKGRELTLAKTVKYLGVFLDSKLSWAEHVERKCTKATLAFWACRKALERH